ncbi:hypothetical protein ILUMI_14497 [Ignelater luminosus]|uniref:Serpin domain-containing protein n=1 Tax=Ignelater luminosus TaxID=2038154 RepID=A0A8K0GAE7_IGNLU|nr:hypothetical protein ILUMI_14497 [Ignelater luminosus]
MGAIKNIVEQNTLSSSTTVLILNAIYFRGMWEQRFDKSQTIGNYVFHTSTGNVLCNMMISENYPQTHYSEENFLVLSLSFHESNIKIVFVVSHLYGKKKISDIEKRFDSKKLFEIIPKLRSRSFAVRIPKFKLEYEIDLKELLSSVGIRKMFERGDFSKLFERSVPSRIEEIKQKALIEMDETGVTAAAATQIQIVPRNRNKFFLEDFILNRTFLFFLYDSTTEIIFLRGRIDNPVSK